MGRGPSTYIHRLVHRSMASPRTKQKMAEQLRKDLECAEDTPKDPPRDEGPPSDEGKHAIIKDPVTPPSKTPAEHGIPPLSLGPARPWLSATCGCCDQGCMWCCKNICCCGCCNLGRAVSIATGQSYLLSRCCGPFCLTCNRCKLAKRYNIDEGGCKSCMVACFCGLCASAQMIQEVEAQSKQMAGCCGNWSPSMSNHPPNQTASPKAPGQQNDQR